MRIEQKEKVSIVSLFAVATLVVIILHYCLPAKKVYHGADDFHVLLTERILDAIEARLDGPIPGPYGGRLGGLADFIKAETT